MATSLTREQMEQVIRNGGSVSYGVGQNVRHITRIEDLPSEAELSEGDEVRAQAALDDLSNQQAQIEAKKQQLVERMKREREGQPRAQAKPQEEGQQPPPPREKPQQEPQQPQQQPSHAPAKPSQGEAAEASPKEEEETAQEAKGQGKSKGSGSFFSKGAR
jgi:outer membrane biosynthesis protein TonB